MEHIIFDAKAKTVVVIPFTPQEQADYAARALPTESDYSKAIQTHIDNTAASRQYADGVSMASYAESTVPAWKAEATAFISWRDSVWSYAYAQLALVQSAQRSQPSVAALISELPVVAWP